MVITVDQDNSFFFTEADQIVIPGLIIVQVVREGITTVADVKNFDDTS